MTREFAQHRLASAAVQPLAMYHQHTAEFPLLRFMQESLQQFARRIAVIAVQVKAVLNRPGAAPQFAQCHARQAIAQIFIRRMF